MRAYSWIAFGAVALACGGGAFNGADEGGEGGSGDDDGGGRAGRGNGGSLIGNGGKLGNGGSLGKAGSIGIAGNLGIAGDLVTAGTSPSAGEPGMGMAGSDVGPEPIDEVCPKNTPKVGGGCSQGLTCSYGSDLRASCRLRAKCDGGQWALYEPDPSSCPAISTCDAFNVGDHCDVQDSNPCIKDGSKYCDCVYCFNGVCTEPGTWQCATSGPQGCGGNIIPNEGQACQGNAKCTYGQCGISEVVEVSCNGATWGWEALGCVE